MCGEQTGHWWYPIYAQRLYGDPNKGRLAKLTIYYKPEMEEVLQSISWGRRKRSCVGGGNLKTRKTKRGEERQQRFDTAKLKNSNTEKAFKLELKNRFHVLQEEQEMNIDSFNQVLTETSKSLQGTEKNGKKNG